MLINVKKKEMILKLNAIIIMALFGLFGKSNETAQDLEKVSIHSFVVDDIRGEAFKFADLKGKKVMIVNTASKCGLTPQYKKLQELYDKYKEDNFIIVGFPANNFLKQEPGTNEDIAGFCQVNYGVTFPMMSKISVKGKNQHPIYSFLTDINKNGVAGSKVTWNFQKYLIDEDGYLVKSISPKTSPLDQKIIEWIEG